METLDQLGHAKARGTLAALRGGRAKASNVYMQHEFCRRYGVDLQTLELVRALVLAGLVIGTAGYYLLIRRRKREGDESKERLRAESSRRAMARFRHLQRRDHA